MFNTLVLWNGSTNAGSTALVDGPTNRKTLRVSADGLTQVSIAHQESNENPGLVTQRSNVRLTKTKEVEETGVTAKAYVQLTISLPKTVFTATELKVMLAHLVNILTSADSESAYANNLEGPDVAAGSDRLYAGEP